jgi:phosphoribosylformylglycinamidine synthase PurS subunit
LSPLFCCLGAIERDCTCLRVRRKYGERVNVKVIVMPKAAVLDPQGNAVRDAMRHLGMPEVRSVRIGKYMEIDIKGRNGDLESRLHSLCRDLLSNPVIEDYELHKDESGKQEKRKTNTNTNAKRTMNQ